LLVADTPHDQRVRSGAWLRRELAHDAKVYYKGRLARGQRPHEHWIIGVQGAREAFASGQLEFLDLRTVIDLSGAGTDDLVRMQTDEVERALDEGWPRIATSLESPHRPVVDEAESAELAARERGYDLLAQRWPLHTLCQLTIEEENDAAIREYAAVHYRDLVDVGWSSTEVGGRWQPRGDLDAHVARRFGAAAYGALDDARWSADGPDLHIDLSAVDFMDVACAERLTLAARSAARHQRVIVHHASTFVRHLIDMVGRPRTLLFDHEAAPP
jgi:anti-anti-sigma regulatory factor